MPLQLSEQYRQRRAAISFELFPPKTDDAMLSLEEQLSELVRCDPAFVTCTYGAGGSTREKTLEVLTRVRALFPELPVATHLTLVGSTVAMLREYLDRALAQGVDYVVALRGDPPKGETNFRVTEGGLTFGNELVALVKEHYPQLGVAVAGYPEKHPECASLDSDIINLKRKVDAGADVVITQLFYNNDDFYRWRDCCVSAGIHVPIVPGILPVTHLGQIQRFTSLCGATIPDALTARMSKFENGSEGQFAVGVYHATRQVENLLANGAPGVHFYVLNKARATAYVCRALAL